MSIEGEKKTGVLKTRACEKRRRERERVCVCVRKKEREIKS